MDYQSRAFRGAIVVALGLCTLAAYAGYRAHWLGVAPAHARTSGAPPPAPVAAFEEWNEGAASPAPADGVALTVQADRSAVLAGSDGRVHMRLELSAPQALLDEERVPADVLVVLDISGSMEGQKLSHAKQALRRLLERLSPGDRVGLVVYESQAQVVAPLQSLDGAGVRGRLSDVIDGLLAGGGTNMGAGIELALRELASAGPVDRSSRILLLSDGYANQGDSSMAGLRSLAHRAAQSEHVLSALGVGDEFNEDLMTTLADAGSGNFYYLSRLDAIAPIFDAEFEAAARTVARAVQLRLRPAPGVRVVDVSGYPLSRSQGAVTLRPGNLVAGQKRTLWATLELPTTAPQVALGALSLRYRRGRQLFERAAEPLPTIAVVDDPAVFRLAIDKAQWEDYVATEEYQRAQLELGKAVGEGDAADVDRVVSDYAQNLEIAEWLDSAVVERQVRRLRDESAPAAKVEQAKPTSSRARSAKLRKADSWIQRRADAYDDAPTWTYY